jgi:hypothetical protein
MVNGMILRELQEADSGHLKHAAKIDGLNQLLSAQAFNLLDIRVEALIKPCGNLGGVVDGIRPGVGREIKFSIADAAEKAMFRGHNMPCQLQRALSHRLRAIVAFTQRYGFNHPLGGFVFRFDEGQREREQKLGLIGSHL